MQYDENAEKYGYEGEMTPMKCDKLNVYHHELRHNEYAEFYLKYEVDAAISELQKLVDKLDGVKKSAELILENLLDCGLIKEWYFNGKFNAILKADDPHLKIAELEQKLEDVQASMYCDVVDANMENRRLRRALWLARADRALEKIAWFRLWNASISTMNPEDGARQEYDKWKRNLGKFLEKAEEYK